MRGESGGHASGGLDSALLLAADRPRLALLIHRPAHLAGQLQPGQIVAIPFGERETAGVIWSLDASDELATEEGDQTGDSDEEAIPCAQSRHCYSTNRCSRRSSARWRNGCRHITPRRLPRR